MRGCTSGFGAPFEEAFKGAHIGAILVYPSWGKNPGPFDSSTPQAVLQETPQYHEMGTKRPLMELNWGVLLVYLLYKDREDESLFLYVVHASAAMAL